MEFSGMTIIVTGASSGIGEATAWLLAARGGNLVLAARRQERLDSVAAAIRADGGKAIAVAGDISSPGFAQSLVDAAVETFGALHAAFNNAGTTGTGGPVADMSDQNWDEVILTNLTSAFHAARAQIPAIRAAGGGSIVFTTSFVGHTAGLPGMGAYAASKAGVNGLVQVLAAELGGDNIRVNALLPGGTLTEMAGSDLGFHAWAADLHALKRLAQPDEIAQAAAFLLSPASSFVTGSAFLADGGNSIFKA